MSFLAQRDEFRGASGAVVFAFEIRWRNAVREIRNAQSLQRSYLVIGFNLCDFDKRIATADCLDGETCNYRLLVMKSIGQIRESGLIW